MIQAGLPADTAGGDSVLEWGSVVEGVVEVVVVVGRSTPDGPEHPARTRVAERAVAPAQRRRERVARRWIVARMGLEVRHNLPIRAIGTSPPRREHFREAVEVNPALEGRSGGHQECYPRHATRRYSWMSPPSLWVPSRGEAAATRCSRPSRRALIETLDRGQPIRTRIE